MASCPACSTEFVEPAAACPRCGLASDLFPAVRSAASGGRSDRDPQMIEEILRAVGGDPTGPIVAPGPATIAQPARFPSAPAQRPPPARRPATELPGLPALGPGDPKVVLRRQIDEYLTLGRRLGIDLTSFPPRMHAAIRAEDVEEYARIRSELFVYLAAYLSEQVELCRARRSELAAVLGDDLPDEEIEELGSRLVEGDLPGTYRSLHAVEELLSGLEVTYQTVQLLSLEADLLAETVRELGSDPSRALGPIATAREAARSGDRSVAERLLARGVLALWHLAAPRLVVQVGEISGRLDAAQRAGADPAFARAQLHEMVAELRVRNFGAAILAYRRARDAAPAAVPAAPTELPPAA